MKNMSDETFYWSIKLVCIGALAILAIGFAFSARAATPAAVWDGDFSKTISGYTLDLNGNTAPEETRGPLCTCYGIKIFSTCALMQNYAILRSVLRRNGI